MQKLRTLVWKFKNTRIYKYSNIQTPQFSIFHFQFSILFNVRCSAMRTICVDMRIILVTFLAFHFQSFSARDAAGIFSWIQCMAIPATGEIERSSLSPRYEILFVKDRPDDEIERQSQHRRQKGDQQDAHNLQSCIMCSGDNIFGRPDDCYDPEENQNQQNNVYGGA